MSRPKKQSRNLTRTMFHLSDSQRQALKTLSKKTGMPMAEFVRRTLQEKLFQLKIVKTKECS